MRKGLLGKVPRGFEGSIFQGILEISFDQAQRDFGWMYYGTMI